MRLPLLSCLAFFAALPGLSGAAWASDKHFVVIYEVTVDAEGKVSTLKVERVLDPSLAQGPEDAINHPVDMVIPETYLAAVRAFLGRRTYQAQPSRFFTYTIFDPSRPDEANPD
jgi:hypothetical protein